MAADDLAVGPLPNRLGQGDKRTVAIDLLPTNLLVTEPHPLVAWKRKADKNYGAASAIPPCFAGEMNFGVGNLCRKRPVGISPGRKQPNYASNRAACCTECDLAKSTKISV